METTMLIQSPTVKKQQRATASLNTDTNVLEQVKQRSAEAQAIETVKAEERAKAKAQAELDALTDFDKSLFKNGNVDFENYIGVQQLFDKFRNEATNGVDVRFADYQKSLVHLLKHCYGYMYALKTDSERYNTDIKVINNAISGLNKTSNANNPLSAKIIKMIWQKQIDRKRTSTYAKVLENAWCRGVVDSTTDSKGRLLPKHFERVVLDSGIVDFSRETANSIANAQQLEKEGYTSLADKKLCHVEDAISSGEFEWNGNKVAMPKPKFTFSVKGNASFNSTRDGAVLSFLCKYDEKNENLVPIYAYGDEQSELMSKTKLTLFNSLNKRAVEKANSK